MPIDLRSDTLTKPTPEMRRAMADAEVGDDVYGEDPAVRALEEETAALFGHEAAVFVVSGTMGNQIALRLQVSPGEELLCHADAHVVTYEHGAAAVHGGITTRTWNDARGMVDVDTIAAMIRPTGFSMVPTAAIAVENTHNRGGGAIQPLETLSRLRALAVERGVRLHCDGARIWNAHVASEVSLATYGGLFDTLSVCLSKGLGAPVGSVIVGSADTLAGARKLRARLGGAWRQAGVLAAAGRYAIAHHLDRLADDHRRAQTLAEAIGIDPSTVETNIVRFSPPDAPALARDAAEQGLRISVLAPTEARMVTHLDVDDADIDQAAKILSSLSKR